MSVRSRAQLEIWLTFLSVVLIAVLMTFHNLSPTARELPGEAIRASLAPQPAPIQTADR